MINNTKAFSLLLAGTVLSSPTMAVEIPQALTLDRLNTETVAFLNNFENADVSSPHDLNIDKSGENDVSVNIEGKTYYLAPKDAADHALLQTLSNIGSAALVKLDSAEGALYRLESDGETFYYGYNAEALPKSGYALAEISAEEAASSNSPVIKKYTKNSDNSLTETYYRVKINSAKFDDLATHETIKWKEISEGEKDTEIANSGVISFAVPGEGVKYYRYSYDPDSYNNDGNSRKLYTERHPNGTFPLNTPVDADFIGNELISEKSSAYGGVIYNLGKSVIGDVSGDFISNYVQGSSYAKGGAVYNNASTIGNINGNFVNNYAKSLKSTAYGGAIHSDSTSAIGNINGDFIHNHAEGRSAYGGVIYNSSRAVMGDLTGDFINNYAEATSSNAYGGAVYNYNSSIGNMTGSFINNFAHTADSTASGGVIYNEGATIGNIAGDFIGNYAEGKYAYGGAVYNNKKSVIGNISGDFAGNYVQSASAAAYGGAVYNDNYATIDSINGNFVNNSVSGSGEGYRYGGAVANSDNSTIGNLIGDFINNSAVSSGGGNSYGGAISNNIYQDGVAVIENISGNFIGNYALSSDSSSSAQGGAIYNESNIKNIVNSTFVDNYVKGDDNSNGGAIYSRADLLITANDGNSLFSGNKVNGKSNAVYMSGTEDAVINLSLNVQNKGVITVDDAIDGSHYDLSISGDGTGVVKINNRVDHVNTLNLSSSSITHLGINGTIHAAAMNAESGSVVVRSQSANVSPIITVDVEVDKASNKVNTGTIHISEDVSGKYRVLVNSLNPDVLDNKDDAIVPFLFAPEDDEETSSSFSVARVVGSPYMWDGAVNAKGEEEGSTWYLNLTDILNPDYKPSDPSEPSKPVIRPLAPEVIAGEGLHEAAIEQTRSVVRNVGNKVAAGREYCPNCGVYTAEWNGEKLRNVWALAQGESATIDKPVKADADIWGLEAGFDLQNDVNNTFGVFVSYRKGDYDLNGQGDKVRSDIGSEIDINSYLAGLYYRYDKNMNWLFAAVYGGVQEADAKTDDGLAKFDTDGTEFGAHMEAGHTFALSDTLTLDPSLGLYYTQINFDDAKDNLGKTYRWKDIKHLEAELGVKLAKQSENAKVYVKPSVIQTVTSGDSVKITGLNKLDTYDDETLGRIELGGRYGFTDALSAYGWANYTFGSGYKATAGGLGLAYTW